MAKPLVKVLLVDDDADDYLLTSEYFHDISSMDFDIRWKNNFQEAVEEMKEEAYDLFVFDYFLGAKTAFDLVEAARQYNRSEPIILLTGVGDDRVDQEASESGVNDYLVKSELTAKNLERSIRYSLKQAATLRALRASETKYRTIFDQSKDVIFICDMDYNLLQVSHSAEELTGYTVEQIQRMKAYDFFETADALLTLEQAVGEADSLENFPVMLKVNGGEFKECLLSFRQVVEMGKPMFIHGTLTDQTNRLKAERATLMSEKLQATGRLMRTLAHEVRNPLTNITLAIDNLEAEIDDEYLGTYLGIIKRNSLRIDSLITEVLNSARQTDVVLTPQPLHPVILQAIQNIADRASLIGVSVETEFEAANPIVPLSTDKLVLALNNLFVNALEAMEGRSNPQVVVTTQLLEQHVLLTIADNGIGIEADKIGMLFEPYFTSKNNGIGLGLAATLSILEAHKATIEVSSIYGIGTEFLIQFPLA